MWQNDINTTKEPTFGRRKVKTSDWRYDFLKMKPTGVVSSKVLSPLEYCRTIWRTWTRTMDSQLSHKWKQNYKKLIDPFKCFPLDQSPRLSHWAVIQSIQWMFSLLSLIVGIKPGCSAPQNLHRRLQRNMFNPEQYSFVSLETNPTELLCIFPLRCLFSSSTHSPAHIRRQEPVGDWSKTDGDGLMNGERRNKEKDSSDGSDSDLESEPELTFC